MVHPCDVEGMFPIEAQEIGFSLATLTVAHDFKHHPGSRGDSDRGCKRYRLSALALAAHMMYLSPDDLEDVKSILERHRKTCTCENSPRDS